MRSKDQPMVDRMLTELWNEGLPEPEIAKRMNWKGESSVRHAALRLNLPRRHRNPETRRTIRVRLENARRRRQERKVVAEAGVEIADRVYVSRDAMFACPHCGIRSRERQGHELCQNRSAA